MKTIVIVVVVTLLTGSAGAQPPCDANRDQRLDQKRAEKSRLEAQLAVINGDIELLLEREVHCKEVARIDAQLVEAPGDEASWSALFHFPVNRAAIPANLSGKGKITIFQMLRSDVLNEEIKLLGLDGGYPKYFYHPEDQGEQDGITQSVASEHVDRNKQTAINSESYEQVKNRIKSDARWVGVPFLLQTESRPRYGGLTLPGLSDIETPVQYPWRIIKTTDRDKRLPNYQEIDFGQTDEELPYGNLYENLPYSNPPLINFSNDDSRWRFRIGTEIDAEGKLIFRAEIGVSSKSRYQIDIGNL